MGADLIAAIRARRDARSSVHRHENGRTVNDLLFEADHDLHLLLARCEEMEATLATEAWQFGKDYPRLLAYAQRLETALRDIEFTSSSSIVRKMAHDALAENQEQNP